MSSSTPPAPLARGAGPALIAPGTAVDTTGDPSWEPVRVTARLAEPVINIDGHPAHLDGPASWGAYLAYTDVHGYHSLPPMTDDTAVDFDLPLARWTAPAPGGAHPAARAADPGMVWGWACSAAHYDAAGYTTAAVRRRPATDEAARYTRDAKWHLAAGPLKARDTPHSATLTRQITWWALADPEPLQRLLDRVHGLGRHTRHGHGRVLSWQVARDPAARTRWRDRTWPDPDGTGPIAAIRAPYHHPTRRMPCR